MRESIVLRPDSSHPSGFRKHTVFMRKWKLMRFTMPTLPWHGALTMTEVEAPSAYEASVLFAQQLRCSVMDVRVEEVE